ncbi:MAG: sigma-70 family RNA polymerase sigma factor [Acidobacteria bacterium]|nr:sigma-70 family RNA polymerase sigma factor [Acidobacteriota bacterium]
MDANLNEAETNDLPDDFPEEHQVGAGQDDIARSSGLAGASADPSTEAPNGDYGALAIYLRQVRRCRQISADGARHCCQTMHEARSAKTPGAQRADRTEEAFWASYNEMVEGNLALVVRIAKPYRRFGLPLEDLIQEGNLGLLAAIRQFDPERGVPFPAYATGWIRQAICRAISIKSRTIRIPLDVLGLRRRATGVLDDLEQEAHNQCCRSGHYEPPTVEDCARALGVSTDRLRTTIRRIPDVESLDASAGPEGEPLCSSVADLEQPNPLECAWIAEQRSLLHAALSELPHRLRHVIQRHYGLLDGEPVSFTAIGRELNLSRERVRQLHNQGLALLLDDLRIRAR